MIKYFYKLSSIKIIFKYWLYFLYYAISLYLIYVIHSNLYLLIPIGYFLKIYLFFNWRIIALQNFVVFCQISTWISHRYPYVPSLLNLSPWTTFKCSKFLVFGHIPVKFCLLITSRVTKSQTCLSNEAHTDSIIPLWSENTLCMI